jgi:glycosyltransferase involved in cell wall biosynthesis
MIYADQRWIGDHGIGRFAKHVLQRLDYHPVPLAGHPAAPFDSWRLARGLSGLTRSDLFFSPGYNTPLYCAAPFVFTIHDLSHVYCPENTSVLIRLYYSTIMKRACRRAASIFTVSEFTRSQIMGWAGVAGDKVHNVSCGVDPAYTPQGHGYGLSFPYLLCVSNRKLHKNEFRTVEGFARSGLAKEIHLVFTGNPTKELQDCIVRNGMGASVYFVGAVPETKLPSLYRDAHALVFASLYEGFGLPILEAMACGVPVLTSNVTAMPEVAGDAALLVNPSSADEISEGIARIVKDIPLRDRLCEKGLRRASEFSWDVTAAKLSELLMAEEPVRP